MVGCFFIIICIGLVIYFVNRGRQDRREQLGASTRPLGSGPIQPYTFQSPHTKCPGCGAAGGAMKQQWDGFRTVTWTCGYCGWSQPQQLKDEELPPQVRQRLGMGGQQGYQQGFDGPGYPGAGGMGSGAGGLLTGMMLGSMLGGGHHSHHGGGWNGDSSDQGGGWDNEGGGDGGWSGGSGDDGGWGGDSGGGWGGDSGGDWGGGGDDMGGGGDDW